VRSIAIVFHEFLFTEGMKVQSLLQVFTKNYESKNLNVPAIIIANGIFEGILLVCAALLYIILTMEYVAVALCLKWK